MAWNALTLLAILAPAVTGLTPTSVARGSLVLRSHQVGVARFTGPARYARSAVRCTVAEDDGMIFGVPADVARPIGTVLAGQLVLFIGVGAIIPTLPLYAKAIGLSSPRRCDHFGAGARPAPTGTPSGWVC